MMHGKGGRAQSTALLSTRKVTTPELLHLPLLCACQGSSAPLAAYILQYINILPICILSNAPSEQQTGTEIFQILSRRVQCFNVLKPIFASITS
jgi:hypothetical protein